MISMEEFFGSHNVYFVIQLPPPTFAKGVLKQHFQLRDWHKGRGGNRQMS